MVRSETAVPKVPTSGAEEGRVASEHCERVVRAPRAQF